jgi:DNA replication protein DnaC
MSNEILNSLLKEYEQKRINSELDLEKRKLELYKQIPRLEEIEYELNHYAIATAKEILNNENNISSISIKEKMEKLKKEKKEILLSEHINDNYLKPNFSCNICKDTGYIFDNNYKSQMCSCLKQKLLNNSFNKSNMPNLDNDDFNNFNSNLFSDQVDLSKYKFNISPRANIEKIKNNAIMFVDNFDNPNCKNLLFIGNTGLR